MPTIELSEATFQRLQGLAKPLIDTTDSVVDRLIDHYEESKGQGAAGIENRGGAPARITAFEPSDMPPLTHTKLLRATIGGRELLRPNWNELVRTAIGFGLTKLGGLDALRRVTDAHVVEGSKTDEGFTPLGTSGVSVQGVDAHDAWRIVFGLARKLSLPVEIVFEWRDKDGAAFPGQVGSTSWSP
jgi:hypothetical protein